MGVQLTTGVSGHIGNGVKYGLSTDLECNFQCDASRVNELKII